VVMIQINPRAIGIDPIRSAAKNADT